MCCVCDCFNKSQKEVNFIINNYKHKQLEDNSELLNIPLKHFFIKTSHNTYINNTQNLSTTLIATIINCIKTYNVRAIELDVFSENPNKEQWTPIVAHGIENAINNTNIYTTTSIYLKDVIEALTNVVFENTSDPFFIIIENNCTKMDNTITNDLMSEIIEKILGDRLFVKPDNYKTIFDCPIKLMLNKIIIISDVVKGQFVNIVNASWHDVNVTNISSNTDNLTANIDVNIFKRVYPEASIKNTLSYNYNPYPYFKHKFNMIAMNYQNVDNDLYIYENFFTNRENKTRTSFVKFI